MKNDLMRFSVAMPEELLIRFDRLVARRGLAKNRSEVVRDLVREALVTDECAIPGTEVMATLTLVYNHHASDVQDKLNEIQHTHLDMVISTTHVHLNDEDCLEVIILRGETTDVRDFADLVFGTKGVKNGGLVTTTIDGGEAEYEQSLGATHKLQGHSHTHTHTHDHTHTH